ncbi:MAG TPA: peptidoglycan-binding domain-containing protein, partial [Alteraurantiacibacter sp.]
GEDTIVSVVQRMVTGFRPVRVAQFSELLEVGDGQYHAYVYETVLRRAQAALRIHGHYTGEEDGRYSASLRDAFLEFQRKSDLEPTGVPDPATLWTLLNP